MVEHFLKPEKVGLSFKHKLKLIWEIFFIPPPLALIVNTMNIKFVYGWRQGDIIHECFFLSALEACHLAIIWNVDEKKFTIFEIFWKYLSEFTIFFHEILIYGYKI